VYVHNDAKYFDIVLQYICVYCNCKAIGHRKKYQLHLQCEKVTIMSNYVLFIV